tara:strand:+ start:163 stop:294 length:132 start_codon:yes stop_codon:yes gene_type:complete
MIACIGNCVLRVIVRDRKERRSRVRRNHHLGPAVGASSNARKT